MSLYTTNLVYWACQKQNENILKECIEMKYNLNEGSLRSCWSPLMVAVEQSNNLNLIKLLVRNGADLNHVNYIGECVLDCTAENDYLLFLQNNGAKNLESTHGMSKLAIEILRNEPCSLTTKEDVNQVDARGLTPLLWAIYYGRQNYIDYYLKLGADVNQAGRTGITPLMMAFYQRNIDIVKKLVENEAKVNQLDHNGLSAIAYSYVILSSSTEIVDYLFENGAKIDPCISEKGRSPLMRAAITNDTDFFNYFLNRNANVNFIDCDGNSVLSYAILNENTKMAEKLIQKGVNLDACGLNGKPALVWSVFLNDPKITQFLLNNGANVNCTDHQGRTALYYAQKYQYTNIIELLKDNGATITISQNKNIFSALVADRNEPQNGKSLLQIAIDENNLNVIIFLLKKGADPRNALGRLKKLAQDCVQLEIILENVLANFNQTNAERKANKTEFKTNKTEYKTNKTEYKTNKTE